MVTNPTDPTRYEPGSVVLLGDPFTALRVGAVLLAVVGVTVLTLGGGDNNAVSDASMADQLTGNLFVLVGAICYALYEVLTEMRVFKGRRSTLVANALCGTIGRARTHSDTCKYHYQPVNSFRPGLLSDMQNILSPNLNNGR